MKALKGVDVGTAITTGGLPIDAKKSTFHTLGSMRLGPVSNALIPARRDLGSSVHKAALHSSRQLRAGPMRLRFQRKIGNTGDF